jgi:hypothetical protein
MGAEVWVEAGGLWRGIRMGSMRCDNVGWRWKSGNGRAPSPYVFVSV